MMQRPFTWSYSRLKNFETCPKRHWHVDIAKDFKEPDSEHLLWGNQVHKQLADTLSKGKPLPVGMEKYQSWIDKIVTGEGNILVEQKFAINKDFAPCGYFDREVWYRGVGDVVKIIGPVALVIDWKTGKIIEDGVQLALMAACTFAHHKAVQKVRTEFVWLAEDTSTRVDFTREDLVSVWRGLWPRIEALEAAYKTTTYPAKPGGLCRRYCPVTECPHHG